MSIFIQDVILRRATEICESYVQRYSSPQLQPAYQIHPSITISEPIVEKIENDSGKFLKSILVLSLELGYGERNTNSVSPVRGYSPGPPPGGAIQYQTSPPTTSYYSSPSPTTPSGSTGANQPATCREQVIASVAAPPTQAYTYSGTTTSKLINRNNYAIFC